MISPMPCSTWSFISRSRICFWMVTSSAVVGSSAISSFGLQAMAMAIITRWHWPPDIWCGKWPSRSAGSGMPTSFSSSMARARRAPRSIFMWTRSTSSIWKPTVKQGLRLAIGSWKIIDMSLPTIWRRSSLLSVRRSVPSKCMRSAVTLAVHGSRPMTASIDTDLPEPDSPTIASTSRLSTASETPSTARKGPLAVSNSTTRLSISSSAITTSSAWDRARRAGRRPSG